MGWDVAGLYYDSRDAAPPVPVAAGTAGWSAPYPVPAGGRVVFYRLQAPAPGETRPRRINLAETRLSEGGPSLVFLLPESEAGDVFAVHAVEDSWELHPAETVRLFSFSKRTIAVKIGSAMAELAPAQSKVLPYAPGRQFWMQAATREAEGWVMRVSSPQVAPPTVRITAVLFDQRPSADRTDTHELQFFKFIETPPAVP